MLTSLELMQATGVSRATLNNYIAQGLIPRPVVQKPTAQGLTRARQIGYFPQAAVSRIAHIQRLKKAGKSMAEIAHELQSESFESPATLDIEQATPSRSSPSSDAPPGQLDSGELRLTIDKIPYAAYLVNYNFEIIWHNEDARHEL